MTDSLRLEPITPEVWAGVCEGLALDVADMPRVDPGVVTAWWILDGHTLVGVAAEYREWAGERCGPAVYDVVYNPTARAFEALWRSQDHPTPEAALDALVVHLRESGDAGGIRAESPSGRDEAAGPGPMHARCSAFGPSSPIRTGHEPEEG